MTVAAVYACVRIITDFVATLPYEVLDVRNGHGLADKPPRWSSLTSTYNTRPATMTQIMTSLLLRGNAYFLVVPWQANATLVPVSPDRVGLLPNGSWTLDGAPADLLHVPGMQLPGQRLGISPISAAAATIDVSMAASNWANDFFSSGALPAAVIQHPSDMTDGAKQSLANSWRRLYSGNPGQVGILTQGATIKELTINPEDAQLLAVRQFSTQEIARVFGVPPHLLGDASGSTSWGSGLDSMNRSFAMLTLRPWIDRIEAVLDRFLLADGYPHYVGRFNLDSLLRGSTEDRYKAYEIALDRWLTREEIRQMEGME